MRVCVSTPARLCVRARLYDSASVCDHAGTLSINGAGGLRDERPGSPTIPACSAALLSRLSRIGAGGAVKTARRHARTHASSENGRRLMQNPDELIMLFENPSSNTHTMRQTRMHTHTHTLSHTGDAASFPPCMTCSCLSPPIPCRFTGGGKKNK